MKTRFAPFRAELTSVVLALVGGVTTTLHAGTTIVALDGEAIPDGSGNYVGMHSPVLNASGQVAFYSAFTGSLPFENGIFLISGDEIIELVRTGQAAPDGNGTYSVLGIPALNDLGQALFAAHLTNTVGGATQGVFRASIGEIVQMARSGSAVPDCNGTYMNFGSGFAPAPLFPNLNVSGVGAFHATVSGAPTGIFLSSGDETIQVARAGQETPDGSATYSSFMSYPFMAYHPAVNNAGQVLFEASDQSLGPVSLYLGSGDGFGYDLQLLPVDNGTEIPDSGNELVMVVRRDDLDQSLHFLIFNRRGTRVVDALESAYPDKSAEIENLKTTLADLWEQPLTDEQKRSIIAAVRCIAGQSDDDIVEIARQGGAAPGGGFLVQISPGAALNNAGQVAFVGNVIDFVSGSGQRIFLSSGDETAEVARHGQAAPDGNGVFTNFPTFMAPNNSGQVAFLANLTGTSGGTNDDFGIFFYNGNEILQIAREGQPVPDSNGVYGPKEGFFQPALNNSGQVVFLAELTGTSGGASDNAGIFLSDGTNTVQIARKGDMLAGSTIASLSFLSSAGTGGQERSGLNDAGQVAFGAILANGRHVIALFTPESGPAMPLRIGGIEFVGNDVELTWNAEGGTTNVVQAGADPMNLGDISAPIAIPGTGPVTTNYTETGGATHDQRFYRVRMIQGGELD